jgi:uncharacterized OB-fold protein
LTVAIPSFAPPDSDHTRPFWDGVAAGELRLPRCSACQAWQWYPLPGTTHCAGATIVWTPVRPQGTIFTFTVVRRPFLPGAAKTDVPIVSIIVELDDAPGLRLVGRLTDGVEARIGMRVTGEFYHHDGRADLQFTSLAG